MAHSHSFVSLDAPVLNLPTLNGTEDAWRVRDACEGTQIFGTTTTVSGKTSGSGQAIAKAFLTALPSKAGKAFL